jgi:hypothetical protein
MSFWVLPFDSEFDMIATAFHASVKPRNFGIRAVRRIENADLWCQYASKRDVMLKRGHREKSSNLSQYEKRWVFHGSGPDVVTKVIQQGLNRSFNGKNATMYGKGCYLARDASYSTTYCASDKSGVKRMIFCRAIVGECCVGRSNQLVPDVRVTATQQLYDSTVDRKGNPSIFVTYHDAQVYPEYVVEFDSQAKTPPYKQRKPDLTNSAPDFLQAGPAPTTDDAVQQRRPVGTWGGDVDAAKGDAFKRVVFGTRTPEDQRTAVPFLPSFLPSFLPLFLPFLPFLPSFLYSFL